MTYFQNIRSLADLKKEYRRLALEHHPDKGGDTAIMQQVNTEFEKLYDVWKDRQDVSVSTSGYEHDYSGATAFCYPKFRIIKARLSRSGCTYSKVSANPPSAGNPPAPWSYPE